MGDIEIQQIKFGTYGDCIKVSNGQVEFIAALEIGPRIIRFGKVDGPNEFFEDKKDEINHCEDEIINYYGGNKGGWHIYGGHRLWTSPEHFPRTYYPDNRKVGLEIIENGIILTQEPQIENGISLKLKATMDDDGIVTVEHYIKNISPWNIELAPWGLTVMQVGGLEVIPQSNRQTDLLHNRSISLWPYSNMADKRVKWHKDIITLKTSSQTDSNFKLGISNDDGYVCYFNHGNLFVKRFDKFNPEYSYPDNNVNYETYTSKLITEIESVGKLYNIKPDETICHTEKWQLIFDVSEPESVEEVEHILEKYVL